MTIKEIISSSKQKFFELDSLDIELIIAFVLDKPREYILAHPELSANKRFRNKVESLLIKRADSVPLAYLTGHKEFYGLDFIVNKHVLIPRPETEIMAEEIIKVASDMLARPSDNIVIADIGTGSGCVILSSALKLSESANRVRFYAIDISKRALETAKTNFKLLNVQDDVEFFKGSLLSPIIKRLQDITSPATLIIAANLPYLTPAQIAGSTSIRHEPRLALDGGADGLGYYRKLLKQIKSICNVNFEITAICEIDPEQLENFKHLQKKHLPEFALSALKDYAGYDRHVVLQRR